MDEYYPLRTKVFKLPISKACFHTRNNWRPFNTGEDAIYQLPSEGQYLCRREVCKENIVEYHYLLKRDESHLPNTTGTVFTPPPSISGICVPLNFPITLSLQEQLLDLFESYELKKKVDFIVSKHKIYPIKSNEQKPLYYGYLIGEKAFLNLAHIQLTVLLQIHEGNVAEFIDLRSLSFIPMIAGVDSLNLKNISASYQTRVFLPNLVGGGLGINDDEELWKGNNTSDYEGEIEDGGNSAVGILATHRKRRNGTEANVDGAYEELYSSSTVPSYVNPQIFLAGPVHSLVLQVKEILTSIIKSIDEGLYYSKLSNISKVKLKYINMNHSKELNHLMMKYQTFIHLNFKKEEVEFQSSSTHLLDLVKKEFTMEILSNICELQLIFHDGNCNTIQNSIPDLLLDLCLKYNITLLVEPNRWNFILIGDQLKLEKVLEWISKNMGSTPLQVKYFIELDPSYKDFISGKKNGKISRIMDTTDVIVNLDLQNGHGNLILTMFANDIKNAILGQKLVSDELPSEKSFFIPEAYHRPVIGTGGSIIQTIMRKHNVFIQFSNSFQLPQNKLAHIRYDNVVIRCPSKNKSEILPAKEELNQLAQEYSEMQPNVQLRLTPGQYRYLLNNTEKDKVSIIDNIGTIERRTSTYIMFPFQEPKEGFLLEIRGNDNQASIAARKLFESFGEELEISLNSSIMDNISFTNSIVVPFLSMSIIVTSYEHLLRFTYKKGNKSVNDALNILRDYLKRINVTIVDKNLITSWIVEPTKQSQPNQPLNSNSANPAVTTTKTTMTHSNHTNNQHQANTNPNIVAVATAANSTKGVLKSNPNKQISTLVGAKPSAKIPNVYIQQHSYGYAAL